MRVRADESVIERTEEEGFELHKQSAKRRGVKRRENDFMGALPSHCWLVC